MELENLILSLAKTLLSKNSAFCVYRYPGGDSLRIAVDPVTVCDKSGGNFRVAPFSKTSSAQPFNLTRLKDKAEIKHLSDRVSLLPDAAIRYGHLPVPVDRETYNLQLEKFLEEIHSGGVQKAVLSRPILKKKPAGFNPVAVFQRLSKRYPATFAYLFYHPEAGMWMGATPELLFRKEECLFYTMALAGTQPRKKDGNYEWREKEIEEQAMVEKHVEEVFERHHCAVRRKYGPETVETAHVAHLGTDYIFEAGMTVDTMALLDDLQPTPAVGGVPLKESLELIEDTENYDRQYYSGYLGEWNDAGDMTVYVNLRCMQIGAEDVAIYVGGGITSGSDPDEEWNETIEKSKTMADLLQPAAEGIKHEVIG